MSSLLDPTGQRSSRQPLTVNPAIMVPLIGGEGHEGAAPRLYEYVFNDAEFRQAFMGSVKLFTTGFANGQTAVK